MISTLLAVCDPGDEVVIFEPFYENYGPDTALSRSEPRFVKLRPPQTATESGASMNTSAGQFGNHTKAIIVNTPNNPTGKVFTRSESN